MRILVRASIGRPETSFARLVGSCFPPKREGHEKDFWARKRVFRPIYVSPDPPGRAYVPEQSLVFGPPEGEHDAEGNALPECAVFRSGDDEGPPHRDVDAT